MPPIPARVCDITARLFIGIARDALGVIGVGYARADVIDLLICFAAVVGYMEGRPMNHSKIAEFCGVPRPTVARKTGEARVFMANGKAKEVALETATPIIAVIP